MRALVPMIAALALSLSAGDGAAQQVVEVRMSLEGLRSEGAVALEAGDVRVDDLFYISFDFERDGDALGRPEGVGLQLHFGAYCRDRNSWVEAVLIAPSGQRWPAHRVDVPQGPDRMQDWSSGYLDDPALLEAVEAGGQFTLALQDDEGRLWNTVVIDTLFPASRQRLFAASLAALDAKAPEINPDSGQEMLEVVELEPVTLPSPPRPCPVP